MVMDIAEDRQRRLVAAGASETGFVLARYLPNGSLDRSFKGGLRHSPGIVSTQVGGGAFGVAVQRDGKIVAAGSNGPVRESGRFVLVRYLPNGSRDPAFGADGRVRARLGRGAAAGRAMALQQDGRIVVGGLVRPGLGQGKTTGLLGRYLPDGSIDRGFGNDGQVRLSGRDGHSIAITDVVALANGNWPCGRQLRRSLPARQAAARRAARPELRRGRWPRRDQARPQHVVRSLPHDEQPRSHPRRRAASWPEALAAARPSLPTAPTEASTETSEARASSS